MTLQTGKQITAIYLLSNILKNKDNQTIKLSQLLEYSMRNIFLEKSCTKCSGEATIMFIMF